MSTFTSKRPKARYDLPEDVKTSRVKNIHSVTHTRDTSPPPQLRHSSGRPRRVSSPTHQKLLTVPIRTLKKEGAAWRYDGNVSASKDSARSNCEADLVLERRLPLQKSSPGQQLLLHFLKDRKLCLFNDERWGSVKLEVTTECQRMKIPVSPSSSSKGRSYSRRHAADNKPVRQDDGGAREEKGDYGRNHRSDGEITSSGRRRRRKETIVEDEKVLVRFDIKLPFR